MNPGFFSWRIFTALLFISLAAQSLIYGVITSKSVIRSDGIGYYLYLPAALVHRDLTLATAEREEFPNGILGVNQIDGHSVIKYPVGEAILQLPFFLIAHAIASATGVNSVFGWPYQAGVAVAGAFYFALGGCFTWVLLREKFSERIALTALGLTVFGTNLFHYATYDAGFSHIYSFCLAACLLVISKRLPDASGTRLWLALGMTGGLIAVTRPTNAVLLLFPLVHWIIAAGSLSAALSRLWARSGYFLAALTAGAMPVIVQLAYWKASSGHWIIYAYGQEGFDFLRPAIGKVLFSVEKGWFIHLPVAFVAVGGWLIGSKKLSPYFPAIVVFAVFNLWIISSWHDWGYGGSFSTRPLVESSSLVALGVASTLYHRPANRWGGWMLNGFAVGCVAYTSLLMLGYWLHTLPYSRATLTDIQNSLALTWLTK